MVSPTEPTCALSLLTPMAAALVPFHASNLKGLQILKGKIHDFTSFLKEFNMSCYLIYYHEGL